jgi:uncharacterized membrane protein YtjA (UPF0391 family)
MARNGYQPGPGRARRCVLIGINEAGHSRSPPRWNNDARIRHPRRPQSPAAARAGCRNRLARLPAHRRPPLPGAVRHAAVAEIGQDLEALRAPTPIPANRGGHAGPAGRSVQRKLAEMDLSVRMRKQGNEDAWKFVLLTDVGKEQMDAIREQAAGSSAARHRASRTASAGAASLRWPAAASPSWRWRAARLLVVPAPDHRAEGAGEQQQRALQQERDLLEQQVRERTATLAEAGHPPAAGARGGARPPRPRAARRTGRAAHGRQARCRAPEVAPGRPAARSGPAPAAPDRDAQQRHRAEAPHHRGPAAVVAVQPGLTASLEILAREFSERSGIEVATALEPVELDESRQLTVYRMVQESLTNIGKYAEARHARSACRRVRGRWKSWCATTARASTPAAPRPSTHGLAGMRHRVETAGGKLTVTSSPGAGTRAASAVGIAKILFVIFAILAIASFLAGLLRRK